MIFIQEVCQEVLRGPSHPLTRVLSVQTGTVALTFGTQYWLNTNPTGRVQQVELQQHANQTENCDPNVYNLVSRKNKLSLQ